MPGTSTSGIEAVSVGAREVAVSDDTLTVDLMDGRTISVPLAWYPRLFHATRQERKGWRLIGAGRGIHWPAIEEDINVSGLLADRPSREGKASFEKWLAGRKKRRVKR